MSPRPSLPVALSVAALLMGWTPLAACGGAAASSSDAATDPDTAVDAVADTASDSLVDTAVDTGVDPAVDTVSDAAMDTAVDTAADMAAETVSDTAADTDATSPPAPAGPCADAQRVGYFEIAHWEFYASIAGQVADGVAPLSVLQEVAAEGGCRLLRRVNPFCDPPCAGGDVCGQDGACHPFPLNVSVGAVAIAGTLATAGAPPSPGAPVTLEANATGGYAKTDVPFPLFEPGAAVTLSAAGDVAPGFELHGEGVEDVALPAETLTMKKGAPLTVTWQAPGAGAASHARIYFTINVDQHGNSPATLACDVADTGSYTVPAALITQLVDLGVSGFSTFDVYRRTVDSVTLDMSGWGQPGGLVGDTGCVELRVMSYAPGKVLVAGHVPCTKDLDCPDGETCDKAIQTCVGG